MKKPQSKPLIGRPGIPASPGKESKVQRVSRAGGKQKQKPVGVCVCGSPLLWVKYSPPHGNAKMRRYCDACFTFQDDPQ